MIYRITIGISLFIVLLGIDVSGQQKTDPCSFTKYLAHQGLHHENVHYVHNQDSIRTDPCLRKSKLYSLLALKSYERILDVLNDSLPLLSEEELLVYVYAMNRLHKPISVDERLQENPSNLLTHQVYLNQKLFGDCDTCEAPDSSYFPLLNIQQYIDQFESVSKKSAVAATCFSAVVPGLGKAYLGSSRQGFGTFSRVVIPAAQMTEALLVSGYWHPQAIFFGAITAPFYGGNLLGTFQLKATKQHELVDQILFLDDHDHFRVILEQLRPE